MSIRMYVAAILLVGCGARLEAGVEDDRSLPLLSTGASLREGKVVVWWVPAPDPRVAGFALARQDVAGGAFVPVSRTVVPMAPPFAPEPGRCETTDDCAPGDSPRVYRLEVLWIDGARTLTAPFEAAPLAERSGVPSALTAGAAPAAAPAPLAIAGDRLKIVTERTGLHAVSAEAIVAGLEGWSVERATNAIASGGFRLTCGTNPVAWLAADGGTGLFFYAESISSIYTRQNVYWLEPGPGPVMLWQDGVPPAAAPDGGVYRASMHYEVDSPGMFGDYIYTDPEADIWFWTYARGGYADSNAILALTVSGVPLEGQDGQLTLHLKGATYTTNAPDHRADAYLNGLYLGQTNWDDLAPCAPSFVVSNLVDGVNTVRLESVKFPGDTAGTYFLVESADLDYTRLYRAQDNALICTGGTNALIGIAGFTTNAIRVFDVTQPNAPVAVRAVLTECVSNGDCRVSFAPATPTNRYLAVCGALDPVSIVGRRSEGWRETTNGADYVVITPPAFRAQAEALAAFRAAQGLNAAVADVTAVYDEFNGGVVSPLALRAFIDYALRHWNRPPQYVVLTGAGTLDYRDVNRAWAVDPCLIPPLTVCVRQRLFGSDNPIADVDGDHVTDVAIGRLPFINTNEFQGWLDKMAAFEAGAPAWNKVAMVADNADEEAGDFPACSDTLAGDLPRAYLADTNYLFASTNQTTAQVRARILGALYGGCSLMTYIGHANIARLADEGLLTMNDVPGLTNALTAPLIVGLTCEFARYERPTPTGNGRIGDRLVRKIGGGMSALWSAVTPAVNDDSVRIGRFLLQALFSGDDRRLGQGVREALVCEGAAVPGSYLLDSYNLLGDPAMRLRLSARRGAIAGRVTEDMNGDGIPQAVDTNAVAGAVVSLQNTNAHPLATAVTADDGTFVFTNVLLGTYLLVETDPPGWLSTWPRDNRVTVALASEDTVAANGFLDARFAGIGGRVLADANGSGVRDDGETNGLAGVSVHLLAEGAMLTGAVTSADGAYLFAAVPPGSYEVLEIDPPNCVTRPPAVNRRGVTVLSGQFSADNDFLDTRLGTVLRIR